MLLALRRRVKCTNYIRPFSHLD